MNRVRDVDVSVAGENSKIKFFQNLWRSYLVIEPLVFLFWLPNTFIMAGSGYLAIRMACLNSLGYNDATCSAVAGKPFSCWEHYSALENIQSQRPSAEELIMNASSPSFNFTVCKAKRLSSNLVDDAFSNFHNIAPILPCIILLFAGGWADRYNKRKAVIMIPVVAKCLFYMYRLLELKYFASLPYQLNLFCALLVTIFGSDEFALMSMMSFLTSTTPKKDRLLRLIIFNVAFIFLNILLNNIRIVPPIRLHYPIYFAISVLCEIVAILYIYFFITEPKPQESGFRSQDPAAESMITNNKDDLQLRSQNRVTKVKQSSALSRFKVLREFFDPTLVLELIKWPFKRRDNNGRLILLLLHLCFFLTIGHTNMENQIMENNSDKSGWYNSLISTYNNFRYVPYLIGNFVSAVILSKILKFSDTMIGLSMAYFTVVFGFMLEFAKDSDAYFIGEVLAMFAMMRLTPIKSTASTIIEVNGSGKLFSFYGIVEPIAKFTFEKMYEAVNVIGESLPIVVLLFNELFYISIVLMLLGCFLLMRRREANLAERTERNEQNEDLNSGYELQ